MVETSRQANAKSTKESTNEAVQAAYRAGHAHNDGDDEHNDRTSPLRQQVRRRMQRLAYLLDDAIPLPGGFRIGLDGIIGVVPVIGDIIGACLSLYIVVEGKRAAMPTRTLLRMLANIGIELVIGLVPIVGDVFDFAFKSNQRNVELVLAHTEPESVKQARQQRRQRRLLIVLGTLSVMLLLGWCLGWWSAPV